MSNSSPFTNPTDSRYRDSSGKWLTESLFLEFRNPHTDIEPLWTIKDKEYKGYPSAKRAYLESNDPTEYTQAYVITENWDHWCRILQNAKIAAMIEGWRNELEVKLRSEAIQALRLSDKDTAHKWLAERGWQDRKVGRPSKKQKEQDALVEAAVLEDAQRAGVRLQ